MKKSEPIEQLEAELLENGRVEVRGFGVFTIKHVQARIGRNPQTGDPVDIPAQNRVAFKSSPSLKRAING